LAAENIAAISPLIVAGVLTEERSKTFGTRNPDLKKLIGVSRLATAPCPTMRRIVQFLAEAQNFSEINEKTMQEWRDGCKRPGPGGLE
jgi:hypothetical protein